MESPVISPVRDAAADLRFFGLVVATVLLAEIGLFWPLITAYFPTNDDTALISASVPLGGDFDPRLWFTRGFSDYFLSIPEWTPHSAEFTRPMSNAWFWLNFQFFGEHWTGQLLVGYLAHALVVAMVGWSCRRLYRQRGVPVFAAMLFVALSPALTSRYKSVYPVPAMMQFPSYHTEIVATLLVLLGMHAFIRRRFALFSLLVSAALLMKETMLGVPVAALLMIGVWRSPQGRTTLINLVWLALPLVLWSVCRSLLQSDGNEVYPLLTDNPLGVIGQVIRNLLLWPGALYTAGIRETLDGLRQFDLVTLSLHGGALLVTALWWLGLGWMLWTAAQRQVRAPLQAPPVWAIVMVFALSNLALVVLLPSTQVRYGYLWFAAAPIAVSGFLADRFGPDLDAARAKFRRPVLVLASLTLLTTTGTQVGQLVQSLSGESLAMYREVKHAAVDFIGRLRTLPPETRKVYVVDEAFSLISSPRHFARLAHFPGELIYLTGVQPIAACTRQPLERIRLSRDGEQARLRYRRAPCLEYVQLAPLSAIDAGNRIERGPTMSYWFPELARPVETGGRAKKDDYRAGDRIEITIRDPDCAVSGACVWIGYDETGRQYRRLD